MRSMLKTKLSCRHQSDQVLFVMKTRQDNDVIDRIDMVYTKIEIRLSTPIWPSAFCDKN